MTSNRFVVTTLVVLLAVIAALHAYPSFVQDPFAPARTKLYGAPAATRSLQDTMASCSLSNAKLAVEALADLMDTFNIDVVAAARNDTIKFKALVDIVGTVSYVANKLGGCEDFVKTLVRNAREVEITVPKTRMCVEESDSEEYKQDPCCSQEAADEQCCAPRSIKIKANAISDFANSTIYNTCRHPEMVKAAISNYYRKYKSNMHQCAFNAAKSQIVFGETIERVTRCYATVFTSPMSCSSDDDCYKGTACDTSSNTCSTQDLQDGTPLVDCIKKSVNADIFENIKYILGVSGKSEAEVIAAFTEFVSSEMCVNGYIPLLPKYELKSESECLAETKCNDNKATCENNNKFCGAIKAANGIYTVDVSGILTTESECNKYGLCVGAKSSDAYKLSKTECEAESFCTNEDCGDNCTKEKCEALGRCLGAGITSFCILPFSYTASGRVCISGERGPSGCINTNINTEVACNLLKGRFISARDTKEKCEALQVCQNEGSITFREKAVCEECGGTSASVFKWAPARYIQRRFVPVSTWATRETKSVNIWKRALDYGKIFPAMTKLVLGLQYPIFKTVVSCTMSPALTIFRNIACDCDPSTPEGTECFSEESLKAAAASFRFLASLATDQQYSTPEVSVIVKAGSKATVSIDVTKTEVLVQVDINNRRAISATDGIPVLKGSATVGQMVGNGFSLTGDKAFSATLCIQRDVTIQTTSTEYVNPAFAIKDSDGNYIVTSIPIDEERSDDGSVQICGVVRDTRTYYPALVNDEAKPPASSASKTGSSLFLVLIAFCVLMML